jgi:formylmethanofuran dehydrogenase subunit A
VRDGRIVAPEPGDAGRPGDRRRRLHRDGRRHRPAQPHRRRQGQPRAPAAARGPRAARAAPADNPLELPSCGTCTPGTLATGYRYAEMGYTSAFEPAMVASNARHAHMEMGDVPIVDHGAYVMLGNDELFLELLSKGCEPQRCGLRGLGVHATEGRGVKVVNPAGISAFKFNQRTLDVDEAACALAG